jgi:predicted AAA+ superfamily ATPase
MKKSLILEILNDWNFWRKELDIGKKRREYINLCLDFLRPNVIVVITGVRRSGKSYLMRQVARELIERGIKKEEVIIVNFEDVRFTEFSTKLLDEIYETYLEVLKPTSKPFIFLDEIHNIPKWERWVRTMHELNKAKIIISGSSSKLLAGELATVLTGRHLDIVVFPLSFKEFLLFKNIEIKNELDLISKKIEIKRALNEYSEFGGFPEVILSEEKKQLLLKYFEDIITKDVEKRYKTRRGEKLRSLASFYLTNVSSPITFNSIADFLKISKNTVEKFSNYLEEAYVVFFVKRFSFSFKEQEKSARKVYSIDVGLANAMGFRFSENKGKLMENLVAIEFIRKKTLNPNLEIYYWKDYQQREVDFVLKEGLKVKQLIQVTYASSKDEVEKREIEALIKASKELKCKNLLVITWDYEDELKAGNKKIAFIPLWKWLLELP